MIQQQFPLRDLKCTMEPHYKEVRYNKTLLFLKIILLVQALYISLCFKPDLKRNLM